MKKEYILFTIIGFGLLSYLLDAVVNPLSLNLATPYHFFTPQSLSKYPFSVISIALKALSILLSSILILGFLGINDFVKGITLFIVSVLVQLYAVQDIATSSFVVTLEWSLGLTLTGMLLFIPALTYTISGAFKNMNDKLKDEVYLSQESTRTTKLKKLIKDNDQ